MPGLQFPAGFRSAALGRGLRRARSRSAGPTDGASETPEAMPPGRFGLNAYDGGSAERARLLRKASVHGRVATQISELMQGNVAERDELRQQLAGLQLPGNRPARPAAGQASSSASLWDQIEVLGRIISWQRNTIDWHRQEDRRLRDQADHAQGA